MLYIGLFLGQDQLPGNQQRLQELTGPDTEIVRHITPHKTCLNCHFYTSVCAGNNETQH